MNTLIAWCVLEQPAKCIAHTYFFDNEFSLTTLVLEAPCRCSSVLHIFYQADHYVYFDILQIPSGCIAPSWLCSCSQSSLSLGVTLRNMVATWERILHPFSWWQRLDMLNRLYLWTFGTCHTTHVSSLVIIFISPYKILFIKPDVFSNLVPFIVPLITPNGVQLH
jgi:hypothetical protein